MEGDCAAEQGKSKAGNGLLGAEPVCLGIHHRCWRFWQKTAGMAPGWIKCILAGFEKGLPVSPGHWVIVTISNSDVCRPKVLSQQNGLWIKFDTANNEGNHQFCVVSGRESERGSVRVPRHFCKWGYGHHCP